MTLNECNEQSIGLPVVIFEMLDHGSQRFADLEPSVEFLQRRCL